MQLSRDLIGVAEQVIFAHPSLGKYFEASATGLSSYFPDSSRVEFIDYTGLNSADVILESPVLLPVNTEHQADNLRSVRAQHPMSLLVAITNDVTGHPTYYAIRSGANFVVNLAIPSEYQSEFVRSQLHIHTRTTATGKRTVQFDGTATSRGGDRNMGNRTIRGCGSPQQGMVDGAAEDFVPTDTRTPRAALERSDLELIRMLRTPMTVAEIARQNYMSERSMYRRIRKIYDTLGITGRVELVRSVAPIDPLAQVTALRAWHKPGRTNLSEKAGTSAREP
jgi:DNA-binding NarL/FixJ family response regulator